jgi:hypothetical protein
VPFRNILLRQSRERLAAFLKEIQRVSESEFPYEQSKASLDEFRTIFKNKLERLNQLDGESDPDIVRQECALASYALSLYLPMLGIVLRSTQVRNAFEVYRPLLRMARNVLDPNPVADADLIQLVLSSGWDYSPYIFPEIPELPGYALIEFPAPESANPLLLPLAGHELGHSLWIKGNLNDIFWPLIDTATRDYLTVHMDDFKRTCRLPDTTQAADLSTDTDTIDAYAQSESWLTSQAEESFCDFVGLKLLVVSYDV